MVDGNVVRVFSRLRAVGAGAGTKLATEHFWYTIRILNIGTWFGHTPAVLYHVLRKLAQGTVDAKRPGDFNQALMEFGATVCTPRSPHCEMCPVNTLCRAYEKVCSMSIPIPTYLCLFAHIPIPACLGTRDFCSEGLFPKVTCLITISLNWCITFCISMAN